MTTPTNRVRPIMDPMKTYMWMKMAAAGPCFKMITSRKSTHPTIVYQVFISSFGHFGPLVAYLWKRGPRTKPTWNSLCCRSWISLGSSKLWAQSGQVSAGQAQLGGSFWWRRPRPGKPLWILLVLQVCCHQFRRRTQITLAYFRVFFTHSPPSWCKI